MKDQETIDPREEKVSKLKREIASLVNASGFDNEFNTPDYILADFMVDSMEVWGLAISRVDKHRCAKPLSRNLCR
jgi:hypothetical protein